MSEKLWPHTVTYREETWQELYFWCPGCKCCHSFRVGDVKDRPVWKFNGNLDLPTFSPSLRVYTTHPETKVDRTLCHLNLTDGKLIFHGDSPHELKGQTVDLPDIPENYGLPGKKAQEL